ncbi:HAD superfamily hydrolase (TIGR01484 family) [Sedimentibacter acidaminivorans]|uniref:HAD superfamily hydrolase (TIGR01484 family) n=1 Tax=Sedimentibacter acidaminivorans TaxID=913099 RepID=A0ABS4G9N1_9FIRM|nr:HAD family hydrolase [Sedimentibacter acidaminivorans]MBP1924252.1 HAD superfamily hydrolase (TIGR01484 family) [Sedimentibacter acidaminivorans]
MIKFIGFDVDNTLCELNSRIKDSTLNYLHEIKDRGVKIAFISGKPAIYLCGFVRQLGLSDITVIGENGAEIYYDANVPPKKTLGANIEKSKYLVKLKSTLAEQFGNSIWFQPNNINVTCFFDCNELKVRIRNFLNDIFKSNVYNDNLEIYEHIDCFDIVIKGVSKGSAIKTLCSYDNISLDEVLTVGDSNNDFSMFDISKISIGINLYQDYDVTYKFDQIDDALEFILNNLIGD